MIIFWLCMTIALLAFVYTFTKDFASPVFVLGTIWTAIYIILFFQRQYLDEKSALAYFFISYLVFCIGFFIPMRRIHTEKIRSTEHFSCDVTWNPLLEKTIILVEYIASVIFVIICYSNIRTMSRSLWQVFRITASENQVLTSGWPSIIRIEIQIVFLVATTYYLLNPVKGNKKILIWSIPPLIVSLLFESRGGWFFVLISIAFLYILIRRPKGKAVAVTGILGITAIFLIFLLSSFDKYSNAYTWETTSEKLERYLKMYFVAPPVSFLKWMSSDYELAYGKYTFRFFCALLHPIFPDIEVVDTVQPFTTYVGYPANVYTALHWYAKDFGFLWTCIVEFALGILYGKFYKDVRMNENPTIFNILMLSMLMFPLTNQFFDDKVFSILSMWVQRAFWILVILKSPITQYESSVKEQ